MILYLDTSALVKLYVSESGYSAVRKRAAAAGTLAAYDDRLRAGASNVGLSVYPRRLPRARA